MFCMFSCKLFLNGHRYVRFSVYNKGNSTTENDRKISKASLFVNDKLKNNLTIEIMWFIIKITPHKPREMLHKENTFSGTALS